jgi:hypothetical protein
MGESLERMSIEASLVALKICAVFISVALHWGESDKWVELTLSLQVPGTASKERVKLDVLKEGKHSQATQPGVNNVNKVQQHPFKQLPEAQS